ncbi:MAG: mechanosensitive ion channel family protein [Anaerolineae bacterium]|nr:mechanosensitive ion channel family protein [Anaerolineae bacterium]
MTNTEIARLWQYAGVRIVAFFLAAWLVSLLARFFARRMMFLFRLSLRSARAPSERSRTLESLLTSAIRTLAFIIAILAAIAQYVELSTLVWVIGLFSAAFGLAARPIISDMLTGVDFIFRDTFAVGEKVMLYVPHEIEGIIETINLSSTCLRAPSGELYTIPNGEIRVVRNFSRGDFSNATISLYLNSEDLEKALPLLKKLSNEAVVLIPDLLEPCQVINTSGKIGQQTELTLLAKARFGRAADVRVQLLTLVHERLSENGISFAN